MTNLITKQLFTLGNSIYLLTEASDTWDRSQLEAQSLGGNLVTINTPQEQTFLAGLFAGRELWLGFNDAGVEGTFKWISGENSAYTNWETGEPNNINNNQDFAILGRNGSWDDANNDSSQQGIIEIKNPTTPILVIEDLGIIEPFNGSKQVVFTVKRFGNSNSSITVNYSTANNTAFAGSDYLATSGTLTFAPGQTVQTISVTVRSDADSVSGENFFVNLSSPTNAILGDNQAKATIREATEAVTFGGRTYLLTNAGNWGQAQVEARTFGGNLVTINSPEEQTFLAGVYAGRDSWIGLSDSAQEGTFTWVSGATAYTNWENREPSNTNNIQDFAILGRNGSWDDANNGSSLQGIIEIPTPLAVPLANLTTRQIFTFGDSIYLLTNAESNWGQAQVEAQSFQGNLVTINTPQEQTFLAGLFANRNLWIGLSDSAQEGTFTWVSGATAYTNWETGEPNNINNNQDFAILGRNGSWDDANNDSSQQGIIEIKNPTTVRSLIFEG
jgi:hypothetical protein